MAEADTASSSESLVTPYESLNEKQLGMSGESFPEHVLVLCDKCYWPCTCFNIRGLVYICPARQREVLNK